MNTDSFSTQNSDNLAAVLYGKKDLRVEEFPLSREIGPTEACIRVHTVGVSRNDVNAWKTGYLNLDQSPLSKPKIMGLETSGTVVAIGEKVTTVKIGDRVHVRPGNPYFQSQPRFQNQQFVTGRADKFETISVEKQLHGHFRRQLMADQSMLYPLPEHISFAEGAMLEPLATGVYACERGQLSTGQTVMITGAGSTGCMTLLAAMAGGATKICVLDVKQERLDFIKTLGATHTVLVDRTAQEMGQKIWEVMGCQPDICIDATGLESAIQTCIHAVKPRGKVVLGRLAPQTVSLPLMQASRNEIDLISCSNFGPWSYKKGYNLLVSGRVNLKPCIGPKFPLTRVVRAFETKTSGYPTEGVKYFIECEQ